MIRVLIADDELQARKRLHRLLGGMENVAIAGEARNGAEVLEFLSENKVDVVLLDVRMPQLTGTEAMALWPEDGPQIIFTTAHAEHALEAFDGGAADYVLKP
ncbi:MAG: response regulator, partial [Planctomycetota bacterium]